MSELLVGSQKCYPLLIVAPPKIKSLSLFESQIVILPCTISASKRTVCTGDGTVESFGKLTNQYSMFISQLLNLTCTPQLFGRLCDRL